MAGSIINSLSLILTRRTDNTAGHIIKCPKKLQAGPLPPVPTALTAGSTLPNKSFPSLERLSPIPDLRSQSASAADGNSSVISSSDSVSLLEVPSKLRSTLSSKTYPMTNTSSLAHEDEGQRDDILTPLHQLDDDGLGNGNTDDQLDDNLDDDIFAAEPRDSPREGRDSLPDKGQPTLRTTMTKSRSIVISSDDNDELAPDHYLLSSRPVTVLGDVANCLLRVYTTKVYDENILLRAMSLIEPTKVLCERYVSIDQAYDYIHLSNIKPSTTEDLQSLRSMLVTMFQEVDTENNGYLTYDEFQLLMERIEVGITAQELRFVIAEADENENGFIDYHEFVPLAVDMIQAFRARSRAKSSQELLESAIEDDILQKVNREEVQRIANIFIERVKAFDSRNAYALRPSELRKCLKSIATTTGLSNSEINMIAQSLPKDAFGRLIYKDFRNTLYKVKIAAMRNMVIESQGNDIHRYLMQLCREEEAALLKRESEFGNSSLYDRDDVDSALTGWLPLRSLINIMISSPRLSLTRLQVMVIASEAEVTEGRVNYLQFTPIAAKTIELMFEPKTLRQRAELIETSDLSPEVLLNGENPQVFINRLKSLFKSYDLERKGELNAKQFRAMLESMDLQLTPSEILSLMAIADYNNNGFISFDEFCEFCMNNLLHLEREKHIRMLQKAIHGTVEEHRTDNTIRDVQTLELHLRQIFQLADKDKNGCLNQDELESLFLSLDIQLTPFQLMVLISECDANNNGMVEYEEFIPICVDILEAAKAKNYAIEKKMQRELEAKQQALSVCPSWEGDVRISAECMARVFSIIETVSDPSEQKNLLISAAKNPLNGLSRTEANIFIAEILRSKWNTERDIIRDLLDKSTKPSTIVASPKAGGGGGHLPLPTVISRYNKSFNELFEIIKSIRLATLMRGILEGIHQSALAKHLLSRFADEAEIIRKEKELDGPLYFLPVKSIVKVLESTTTLRLHMAQILTLISWADSFQSPGLGIDYRDFAYYAADVIAKMYDTNELQKRSNVLAGTSIDDATALRGATKESIENYLREEFSKVSSIDHLVSSQAFFEIIRSLPRLQLSDRETSAVLASVQMDENGMYNWESFLPWAYGSIRAVCIERMIGRRVALMGVQSAHEEDHIELMKLGDRLIDISIVRKIGGYYSIAFVSETTTKNPRRSSLLPVKKKEDMHDDTTGGAPTTVNRPPQEVFDILRTACQVPFRGVIPKELLANHSQGIYLLIRIAENDPVLCYDQPPLVIKALSRDCEYSFTLSLNLRLPSLGLVDQEAAEQFALNLTTKLYLKYEKNDTKNPNGISLMIDT